MSRKISTDSEDRLVLVNGFCPMVRIRPYSAKDLGAVFRLVDKCTSFDVEASVTADMEGLKVKNPYFSWLRTRLVR